MNGSRPVSRQKWRRSRGVTLIELIVVVAITALMSIAVSSAFVSSFDTSSQLATRRAEARIRDQFETELRRWIENAYMSDNVDIRSAFLVGDSTGTSGTDPSGVGAADRLTLTVLGQRLPGKALGNLDDFETANSNRGPVGGISEVSLSLEPVGEPGGREGLFLRVQTPADGDPTQGGTERVFDSNVNAISFEFFDGQNWMPTWDSQTNGERRLPAAIRVSYTLTGDETVRQVVIRLVHSDATSENPVGVASG